MNQKNYFKNHPSYKYEENLKFRDGLVKKYNYDLQDYLSSISKWKILEIATWIWNFAYFCHKLWVENYTGIDIDDYFFQFHKKEFWNYEFVQSKFQDYLDWTKKYDVIFTSHLFEHLDEKERVEIIHHIHNSLNNWWIWVNYMPNADSVIEATAWMYIDITHHRVYNTHSFSQLINYSWVYFSEIKNLNAFIGCSFIKRLIHNFFLIMTKIYYLWMGRNFPAIYTWEIISILKK